MRVEKTEMALALGNLATQGRRGGSGKGGTKKMSVLSAGRVRILKAGQLMEGKTLLRWKLCGGIRRGAIRSSGRQSGPLHPVSGVRSCEGKRGHLRESLNVLKRNDIEEYTGLPSVAEPGGIQGRTGGYQGVFTESNTH